MRMIAPFSVIIALTLPAALAAESYSMNGTGKAQSSATTHEVAEGHMLISAQSEYTSIEAEDENNPLNGATGPCFGAMEIVDGSLSGGGRCLYTDQTGDMAVLSWTAESMTEDGANAGSWELTGGSGKYEGGSGGGSYSVATDQSSGSQTNTVTGEISLP
ncbi:hypothetical protein ACFSUD_14950 [Sulfitobacter aestuarii]|uniref:Uncharacterized protein n=1 Tax=Sulfitobacter aestuarii TaxID=2161676 RepID=A0ABW5U6E1_9RHOB